MKLRNSYVTLTVLIISQCSYSATIQDVKQALDKLRTMTANYIDEASLEFTKMSNEIDSTALWTKELGRKQIYKKADKFIAKLKADEKKNHRCRGSRKNGINNLKKSNLEELVECVDTEASNGLDMVFKMKSKLDIKVSKAIYQEEKNMIACGQSNHKCLDRVVADIKDKIDSVDEVVQSEMDVYWYNTEVQLDVISECAFQTIFNTELSLNTISNCLY